MPRQKKYRHRAEGEIFLLTFSFIGLLRVPHLSGLCLRLCYKVPLPRGDDHCLSLIFFRGRNLLLKSSWKFSVVQVYRLTKTSQCINWYPCPGASFLKSHHLSTYCAPWEMNRSSSHTFRSPTTSGIWTRSASRRTGTIFE